MRCRKIREEGKGNNENSSQRKKKEKRGNQERGGGGRGGRAPHCVPMKARHRMV